MKFEIYGNGFDEFDVSEDLNGVTVFDSPHSGKVRVKTISDIRVLSDGSLALCCELREDDQRLRKNQVSVVPDIQTVPVRSEQAAQG